ncbi:MAG: AmmeMemoRadiSam system radical SAM enzyme [Candidatus Lernaella stagnicola]|nr:AmmeMemoRadiSam system radical SAM enzyme [Candidatus Lernaella stagnicola]
MTAAAVTARFQTKLEGQQCRCELCPRHCVIDLDGEGFCGHRANRDGNLIAVRYGQVAALAIDPIEKKPLYHFHPGSPILSVGANGCNLACRFCQNWHLSTGRVNTRYLSPEALAAEAGGTDSIGVAFTYNEPTVWFEYIIDNARLLHDAGRVVVLVTNGYLESEPWDELCGHVDAMNIDVKGDDAFYRSLTGGRLAPVRRNVEAAWRAGVHVEVTNLLVTDANDDPRQVRELVSWLASVSPLIPLHLSRYFPNHRHEAPPTPIARLEAAVEIAREQLQFVYAGNAHVAGGADTHCPKCGAQLVKRSGYRTRSVGLDDQGRCAACGGEASFRV